jgi:hypothetical protein
MVSILWSLLFIAGLKEEGDGSSRPSLQARIQAELDAAGPPHLQQQETPPLLRAALLEVQRKI